MFQNRRVLGKAAIAATVALSAAVTSSAAQANSERVLYSFTGGSDGSSPFFGLVRDASGNLYGVTPTGGVGHGVVFKVSPRGKEAVLYTFTGGNDGSSPSGPLAMDGKGNLYGTTEEGGANGWGVVFKLTPRGREIVLFNFTGGDDGGIPGGGVIIDPNGNFYGITESGGANSRGVVYRLTPRGRETVLYTFTGGADGATPVGGLVMDGNGVLYGTTERGGPAGDGVVFKVPRRGKEIVLHGFTGGADGALPYDALLLDAAGNLYGTAEEGGTANSGVVFKLSPRGRETVLHSFAGGNDGAYPVSSLVVDTNGNLYGTTNQGGTQNGGTVFMLSPRRRLTTLHNLGGADGYYPSGTLVRDTSGNLYGTAEAGGADNFGTVFRINN